MTTGSSQGAVPEEATFPRSPMNDLDKMAKRGVEEEGKKSGHKAKE